MRIRRHRPRLLGALALTLLAGPAFAGSPATPERRPNVILIMADDLGWGELGCYGQEKIRTPSMDAIAAAGMRFTDHYSGSAVCAPSRCMLLTGLHSGRAYVRNNSERGKWGPDEPEGQKPLPADTTTLGTLFQAAGYATAAIGKWGLGGPETTGMPHQQGFDLFFGYLCQRVAHNLYPTHLWRNDQRVDLPGNEWGNLVGETYSHDEMVKEALDFIDASHQGPFFLYLPFHIPHLAIQVPEDSLQEYQGLWEDPPYEGGKGYLPHPAPRAGYAAMVTRMDRDIGRILERVEGHGLTDDTIVLVTSDNGPTYGRIGGSDSEFFRSAGPFRGLKGSLYEGGIRVPLLARWPGRIEGGAVSHLASAHWDLLPTLMDLCGLGTPEGVSGVSLAPTLLAEGEQLEPEFLYWEFPSYGGQQAIRMGRFKAIRRNLLKEGADHSLKVYDLEADVGETRDVAAAHPEVVARAPKLMHEARVPSKEFPFPFLDEENAPAGER